MSMRGKNYDIPYRADGVYEDINGREYSGKEIKVDLDQHLLKVNPQYDSSELYRKLKNKVTGNKSMEDANELRGMSRVWVKRGVALGVSGLLDLRDKAYIKVGGIVYEHIDQYLTVRGISGTCFLDILVEMGIYYLYKDTEYRVNVHKMLDHFEYYLQHMGFGGKVESFGHYKVIKNGVMYGGDRALKELHYEDKGYIDSLMNQYSNNQTKKVVTKYELLEEGFKEKKGYCMALNRTQNDVNYCSMRQPYKDRVQNTFNKEFIAGYALEEPLKDTYLVLRSIYSYLEYLSNNKPRGVLLKSREPSKYQNSGLSGMDLAKEVYINSDSITVCTRPYNSLVTKHYISQIIKVRTGIRFDFYMQLYVTSEVGLLGIKDIWDRLRVKYTTNVVEYESLYRDNEEKGFYYLGTKANYKREVVNTNNLTGLQKKKRRDEEVVKRREAWLKSRDSKLRAKGIIKEEDTTVILRRRRSILE